MKSYLQQNPIPGPAFAIDETMKTYEAYYLKAGFFGMPRVLLLDRKGIVVFEGDPGLRKGEAWKPADGPTYVDGPLDKLLGK